MTEAERDAAIDWRLTTWEGTRREQLRRWAELPLERIILALEEMEELADRLQQTPAAYETQRRDKPRDESSR
jgi:hypothetical protein